MQTTILLNTGDTNDEINKKLEEGFKVVQQIPTMAGTLVVLEKAK